MSSHHIVRDEQEPALLIADLAILPDDQLGELLEWAPTTVLVSTELERAQSYGFKIDIILCLENELEMLKKQMIYQAPIRFITVKEPGDYLSETLHYLVAAKYGAINIVADFSSFLDHKQNGVEHAITMTVYDGKYKWNKANEVFKKWVASDSEYLVVSDFDVQFHRGDVESSKSELGHLLKFRKEGTVEVNSSEPFWLGEKIIKP